ncbi:hypothetical protein AAG570_001376 [Ranatra chinensis]|uniref:Uncharacterized protein n=1 Tax=Ranatra chinensis TaxID=642074 RepID=A0ABD0YBP7_9HEMI
MASKRRNMFYQNKKQETTEIEGEWEMTSKLSYTNSPSSVQLSPIRRCQWWVNKKNRGRYRDLNIQLMAANSRNRLRSPNWRQGTSGSSVCSRRICNLLVLKELCLGAVILAQDNFRSFAQKKGSLAATSLVQLGYLLCGKKQSDFHICPRKSTSRFREAGVFRLHVCLSFPGVQHDVPGGTASSDNGLAESTHTNSCSGPNIFELSEVEGSVSTTSQDRYIRATEALSHLTTVKYFVIGYLFRVRFKGVTLNGDDAI